MRYITGSRMFRFGEAMSILARSTARAVRELAVLHADKQIKIFLDRTIAVGLSLPGLGERCRGAGEFRRSEVIDVGLAVLDELERHW